MPQILDIGAEASSIVPFALCTRHPGIGFHRL